MGIGRISLVDRHSLLIREQVIFPMLHSLCQLIMAQPGGPPALGSPDMWVGHHGPFLSEGEELLRACRLDGAKEDDEKTAMTRDDQGPISAHDATLPLLRLLAA